MEYRVSFWTAVHTNCSLFSLQWREACPDSLMDSKLKCVFEMPNDINSLSSNFSLTEKDDLKKKEVKF